VRAEGVACRRSTTALAGKAVVNRGFQVPRRPPLAIMLVTGALALASACWPVRAQVIDAASSDSTGSILFRPALDGDARNPPRFDRPESALGNESGRFLPNFTYQPAIGAGTTGFDSANARRRKPGQPSSRQPTNPRAGAKPLTTKNSPADAGQRAVSSPRQLQAAAAPLSGRLYNQVRPGAPPLASGLVAATVATTPPSRRQPPQERPFDPLGIQVGTLNFRPAMEYSRGYDTNAPRNSTGPTASSWYNIYAPELLIASNWARHELTASLQGAYYSYDTNHGLDRPSADAKANARIDVTSRTRIELEGRYRLFTDNPGNPDIQVGLVRIPIAMTYGATGGFGHRFNRFDVVLKSTVERTVYNDSEFIDGTTASNAGRNFNRYGSQLRTSYELTPGVKPFVEIGGDLRKYDLEIDAGGVNRTSQGYTGKAGTTFELSRKLTGEVALGYLGRIYTDPTLEDIRGPSFDASLTWLASALTTVKFTAATAVMESTLAGVSGAFTREVGAQVDHAFRRWLTATLRVTRGFDDYVGSPREDIRYVAAAALAYSLTRELRLKGEYRNEWRHSNIPGNDFFAHVWLVGLRLQR
jgi:hypothetical protein